MCGVLIYDAISFKKNHHSSKYAWDLARELQVSYSPCLDTIGKGAKLGLRGGTSGRHCNIFSCFREIKVKVAILITGTRAVQLDLWNI